MIEIETRLCYISDTGTKFDHRVDACKSNLRNNLSNSRTVALDSGFVESLICLTHPAKILVIESLERYMKEVKDD